MNKCFVQFWAESEINSPIRLNGCSFHLSESHYMEYLENIYKDRNTNNIPEVYDRKFGNLMECFINDEIYNHLEMEKSIKINESSKNNLIKSEKIIFKPV